MPAGRPTVMTEEVLAKLRQAFKAACTDKEACAHAGIAESTLYDYQVLYPEFVEEKEALKESPVIAAKLLLARRVGSDSTDAKWYLERKKKNEFSGRQELTGADGAEMSLKVIIEDYGDKDNSTAETEGIPQG